jgi:hypothetical protein
MSRWEPVNKSIERRRQADGCGKLLIILVVAVVMIGLIFVAWKIGNTPRCWACNHPRHEQRMCGWAVGGMGTCICEKDKR